MLQFVLLLFVCTLWVLIGLILDNVQRVEKITIPSAYLALGWTLFGMFIGAVILPIL